jgi:hypothetical protein
MFRLFDKNADASQFLALLARNSMVMIKKDVSFLSGIVVIVSVD